jgi:hypothetical protein
MDVQTELFYLKPQIENETPLQLNWSGTRVMSWITFIVALVVLLILLKMTGSGLKTSNLVIAGIIALLLFAWASYLLFYAAIAVLAGPKLTLKKLFSPEVTINVNQIEKVSGFNWRRTYYSTVSYKGADGKSSKAVIINSMSPLFGEEVPVRLIIEFARSLFVK